MENKNTSSQLPTALRLGNTVTTDNSIIIENFNKHFSTDGHVFLLATPTLANSSDTSNQIKCIYIALRTSADISKCCTETQPKTPNSKQCRCKSTVARKNSLERPKPRKKPREEPGYVGWPVLFWLCRVEIITEHDQDVQMFINDQHGRIIIRQNS